MNLNAYNNYIIVKPEEKKTTTESGLYLPGDAQQNGLCEGVVCSVGAKVTGISAGAKIVFSTVGSVKLEKEGSTFYITSEQNVYATYGNEKTPTTLLTD
jgi:co-chaperonin GroES (HSP10)